MAKAWKRILTVKLTSTAFKKTIVLGEEGSKLDIQVTGSKYLSTVKDNFIVTIRNLTYNEIADIINGKFYDVEIVAGYKTGNAMSIFNGGVVFVSNDETDSLTNTVKIICASQLVAKFGQRKLNLTLNGGLNMYSVLTFMCKAAGISNPNIGNETRLNILKNDASVSGSISTILEQISNSDKTLSMNADLTSGASVSAWNIDRKALRYIKVTNDNLLNQSGYPTISSDGLRLAIMPTFNYMPGDVIVIPNSLIDVFVNSLSEAQQANRTNYFDPNGQYMILEQSYNLENRGGQFFINIVARALSMMSTLNIGGRK